MTVQFKMVLMWGARIESLTQHDWTGMETPGTSCGISATLRSSLVIVLQ